MTCLNTVGNLHGFVLNVCMRKCCGPNPCFRKNNCRDDISLLPTCVVLRYKSVYHSVEAQSSLCTFAAMRQCQYRIRLVITALLFPSLRLRLGCSELGTDHINTGRLADGIRPFARIPPRPARPLHFRNVTLLVARVVRRSPCDRACKLLSLPVSAGAG